MKHFTIQMFETAAQNRVRMLLLGRDFEITRSKDEQIIVDIHDMGDDGISWSESPVISSVVEKIVHKLFAGRKGHGGAVPITRRVMWPDELRAALQVAYDAGKAAPTLPKPGVILLVLDRDREVTYNGAETRCNTYQCEGCKHRFVMEMPKPKFCPQCGVEFTDWDDVSI